MTTDRLSRLTQLLESSGFDALALNPGPSLTYLTGLEFHLMERPTVLLIAPPAAPILILPELETPKLKLSRIPLQGFTYGDNPASWGQAFQDAAQAAGLIGKRVAVEPNRLRFLELEFLQKAVPSAKFVSGESVLTPLRMHKDAQELAAMRRAGHIARQALDATLPLLKPGITEREAASELTVNLLRCGSDTEQPFAPIVEFGENSANPHGVPTDRRLKEGDLILFDWGARYQGYCSDVTRVFAKGKIDRQGRRWHDKMDHAAAPPGCPTFVVCHHDHIFKIIGRRSGHSRPGTAITM